MDIGALRKTEKKQQRGPTKKVFLSNLFVTLILASFFGIQVLRENYSLHPTSGTSMAPALTEKEMVLVKKNGKILRYDIIAFSVSKEEGMFVKRVVGLPGDAILVRNNQMVLDISGQGKFETTYTIQLSSVVAQEFQNLTQIPEDMYFTLGDNASTSKDSRKFGLVHQREIEGSVRCQLPTLLKPKEENE